MSKAARFSRRREELSAILDSTNPDLSAFHKRGGKMIVTIGTNDTLASPGAQLDYFQSVLDKMGRATVDRFARFFVMPQAGHGLSGTNYVADGEGRALASAPIPNRYDQLGLLFDWVENNTAPGMSVTVTAGEKSLPLCSYPTYPTIRGRRARCSRLVSVRPVTGPTSQRLARRVRSSRMRSSASTLSWFRCALNLFEPPGRVPVQQARDQRLIRQPLGERPLLNRLQVLARETNIQPTILAERGLGVVEDDFFEPARTCGFQTFGPDRRSCSIVPEIVPVTASRRLAASLRSPALTILYRSNTLRVLCPC